MRYVQNQRTVTICDDNGCVRCEVKTPADVASVKPVGSSPGYVVITLVDGRQAAYSGYGKCLRNDWIAPPKARKAFAPQPPRPETPKPSVVAPAGSPFAKAAKVARELGHGELARYVDFACDIRSPVQRPAAGLGHVFLQINGSPMLAKVASDVANRHVSKPERVRAWLGWMGFLRDRARFNSEQYALGHIVEEYVRCAVASRDEGWEDVKCLMPWIGGMQKTRRKRDPQFEEALKDDSVSRFELLRTIGLARLTRTVLRDLIDAADDGRIAEHVLANGSEAYKLMTPREILLHTCVACPSDEKSVRIVYSLLKKEPGILAACDRNGFTPLVYTLFGHRVPLFDLNKSYARFPRRCRLESYLVEKGVSPMAKDRFGLSWSDLVGTFDLSQALPGWNVK